MFIMKQNEIIKMIYIFIYDAKIYEKYFKYCLLACLH